MLLLTEPMSANYSDTEFMVTPEYEVVWQRLEKFANFAPKDGISGVNPSGGVNGLVLVGAAGTGKSHLAQIWQNRTKARRLEPSQLQFDSLAEFVAAHPYFLLDPMTRMTLESEKNFFHFLVYWRNWGAKIKRMGC